MGKALSIIFIGFLIAGLGITAVSATEKLAHEVYQHSTRH